MNQDSVTIEFDCEEHDLLVDVIVHAMDSFDFAMYGNVYDLPLDSEIRQRYFMLTELKDRCTSLWSNRFDSQS